MRRHFQTGAGAEGLPAEFVELCECPFSDICIALDGRADADSHGTTVGRQLGVFNRQPSGGDSERTESRDWGPAARSNEVSDTEVMNLASDMRWQLRRVE
jgi:hypothetical protein